MADDKPIDPAAMFQEWVTQWERATDKFSNQLMGTDNFSKYLNQMQNSQLEFQRTFGELMGKQLASMNMPSREDVLRISEDIQGLDRRIARIEASLQKLVAGSDPSKPRHDAGPPRTKKPATADKKPDKN